MERQALSMKRVVIIGGGIGGLSAAARLAHAGYAVTVLEQQEKVGGKLQRIQLGEYRFDRGPSTITMTHAFRKVFVSVGRRIEDYINFYRLEHGTRNCFTDGSVVDLSADPAVMEEQISRYSPEDARRYRAFMAEAAVMYGQAERHFMNKMMVSWQDKLSPGLAAAFVRIRPLTKLSVLLRRYFRHPNTLALFGRYATYVGSAPNRAPAIFAMLPHVEAELGIFGVRGGTYSIIEGLRQLAEEMGAEIHTSTRVQRIVASGGRVSGVETDGGFVPADLVLANGDVLSVCRDLLGEQLRPAMTDRKMASYEPSLSGFVTLAGIRRRYDKLLHHTVFYPQRYGEEFEAIFERRVAPADPAIYICCSAYSEPDMAPEGGSNLFILANAPYTSDAWSWEREAERYQERLLKQLAAYGLVGLERNMEQLAAYTPEDLERDTSAFRGAIYGISSNSAKQTFMRPSNRADLRGLWFAGGTTHPGGGTPMVAMSGLLTAEAMIRQHS
ncbi:phytoene desaturase family protein [Paenibacillus sp. FSL H8-0537]|uniref:phytoene desaturase family protein n=1 Tax=Paenibacillus sp. FSL H8-0537 TaxID=2921399 RepID=UPI003101B448